MKAAVLGSVGLEIADIAPPQPGDDDVLVRVHAAALNHADLGVLAGHMHGAIGGPGTVLGLEWAGEVMALGRHVAHLRVGDRVMGSGRDAWPEQVRAATAGRGVDLVVDMLSGATLSTAMAATAIGGRIVNVGRLAGQRAAFDFDLHALRRIQYIGVTFRTRSVAEVREVVQRMRADLWPALQAGQLMLPVAAQFPLLRVDEAFALLAAKTHFGKIVVNVA